MMTMSFVTLLVTALESLPLCAPHFLKVNDNHLGVSCNLFLARQGSLVVVERQRSLSIRNANAKSAVNEDHVRGSVGSAGMSSARFLHALQFSVCTSTHLISWEILSGDVVCRMAFAVFFHRWMRSERAFATLHATIWEDFEEANTKARAKHQIVLLRVQPSVESVFATDIITAS